MSEKVVGRLAFYRRILLRSASEGLTTIFSHEIAAACDGTPAQVRRDLMAVGSLGHPIHGYDIGELLSKLDRFLDARRSVTLALVGVGNLGRALLAYFGSGRSTMAIRAAFDSDPAKAGRTIGGCRVHPLESLTKVVRELRPAVGIIAVPDSAAQGVASQLVKAGVRSLVNLSHVHLRVPPSVFVEDVDLGIAIERAAFFSRRAPAAKTKDASHQSRR